MKHSDDLAVPVNDGKQEISNSNSNSNNTSPTPQSILLDRLPEEIIVAISNNLENYNILDQTNTTVRNKNTISIGDKKKKLINSYKQKFNCNIATEVFFNGFEEKNHLLLHSLRKLSDLISTNISDLKLPDLNAAIKLIKENINFDDEISIVHLIQQLKLDDVPEIIHFYENRENRAQLNKNLKINPILFKILTELLLEQAERNFSTKKKFTIQEQSAYWMAFITALTTANAEENSSFCLPLKCIKFINKRRMGGLSLLKSSPADSTKKYRIEKLMGNVFLNFIKKKYDLTPADLNKLNDRNILSNLALIALLKNDIEIDNLAAILDNNDEDNSEIINSITEILNNFTPHTTKNLNKLVTSNRTTDEIITIINSTYMLFEYEKALESIEQLLQKISLNDLSDFITAAQRILGNHLNLLTQMDENNILKITKLTGWKKIALNYSDAEAEKQLDYRTKLFIQAKQLDFYLAGGEIPHSKKWLKTTKKLPINSLKNWDNERIKSLTKKIISLPIILELAPDIVLAIMKPEEDRDRFLIRNIYLDKDSKKENIVLIFNRLKSIEQLKFLVNNVYLTSNSSWLAYLAKLPLKLCNYILDNLEKNNYSSTIFLDEPLKNILLKVMYYENITSFFSVEFLSDLMQHDRGNEIIEDLKRLHNHESLLDYLHYAIKGPEHLINFKTQGLLDLFKNVALANYFVYHDILPVTIFKNKETWQLLFNALESNHHVTRKAASLLLLSYKPNELISLDQQNLLSNIIANAHLVETWLFDGDLLKKIGALNYNSIAWINVAASPENKTLIDFRLNIEANSITKLKTLITAASNNTQSSSMDSTLSNNNQVSNKRNLNDAEDEIPLKRKKSNVSVMDTMETNDSSDEDSENSESDNSQSFRAFNS